MFSGHRFCDLIQKHFSVWGKTERKKPCKMQSQWNQDTMIQKFLEKNELLALLPLHSYNYTSVIPMINCYLILFFPCETCFHLFLKCWFMLFFYLVSYLFKLLIALVGDSRSTHRLSIQRGENGSLKSTHYCVISHPPRIALSTNLQMSGSALIF